LTTSSKLFQKVLILFSISIVIIIVAISLFLFFYQTRTLDDRLESDVKNSAGMIAALIDGDLLSHIRTSEDYKNAIYMKLYRMLDIYKNESSLPIKSIQILRREGDVTSVVIGLDEINQIGREYNLFHEMNPAFNSGLIGYKPTYVKETGMVVSGFAPIKTKTGMVAGILQVDVAAGKSYPPLNAYLYIPVIIGIIVLTVGLIVLTFLFRPFKNSLIGLINYIKKYLWSKEQEKGAIERFAYLGDVFHELELAREEIKKRQVYAEDKESLQRQIKGLMQVVNAAAEGDFTSTATVTADTLGVLGDSFNLMISDLSVIIRDVKKSVDHLAAFAKDVLVTTKAMTQGADKQANALDKVTSVIRDMSEINKKTDQSAEKAAGSAQSTKNLADGGSKTLENFITSMSHIRNTVQKAVRQVNALNESSARIGEITDFIGDISTRTNLLALNATIEAARAGPAGRGFSIVAEEVRNLADRAKRATVEISNLVEEIKTGTKNVVDVMDEGNRNVTEGAKLVDDVSVALRDILGSSKISATSAQDISEATKRQLTSSEEVVVSIDKIVRIARQTAEGAKKTEIEITRLEKMADSLNNAVSKFKLSE
jgi:methyl-accepting chemotaxis protein